MFVRNLSVVFLPFFVLKKMLQFYENMENTDSVIQGFITPDRESTEFS